MKRFSDKINESTTPTIDSDSILSKYQVVFFEDAPSSTGTAYERDDVKEAMVEFAKFHVRKALEKAHINMQLPEEDLEFTLESYPETNIK